MPAIALGKGRSKRAENLPIRLSNMLFEADPTNVDDQTSLISRHGLNLLGDAGAGFIAGMIRREDANDSVVGVSGEFFFAVTDSGVSVAGTGGISGTGRVRMATDGSNTFIVRNGMLYNKPLSGSVVAVAMPDGRKAYDVVYMGARYWIASEAGRVYFTQPGEVTVDPLDYFTAETSPDPLKGIAVESDQLVLLGSSSIEWWYQVPDPDLPATRTVGRRSTAGLASVFSMATADVGLFWVGNDGIVYRSGSLPVPIGDATVTEAIARARPILDESDPEKTLSGWFCAMGDHGLYHLDVPGEGTHVYDLLTGQWTDFGTSDRPLYMAGCAAMRRGRWLVGGTFDSKVRELRQDRYKDDTGPLIRRFPGLSRAKQNIRFSNVQVECSTGGAGLDYPGDNPQLAMRYSDDGGKTWSDWDYASLGRQGDYRRKPRFAGPRGLRPGTRIWEWRMSEDLPFVAHTASYNEPVV